MKSLMGIQSGNNYMVKEDVVLKVNLEDIDKRSKTPILTYCRKLIKEGFDPRLKLYVFGENKQDPDVVVSSIGQAAKLTVEETPLLGPRFVKYINKNHLTQYKKNNKLEAQA